MSTDIFEEPLEVEIGLLEADAPTAESYPYPSLKATSAVQRRSFRAVVLENGLVRAAFVPALGGRLLSFYDKRTGVELLSSGPLVLEAGGRRGARLLAGVELHLDGAERLTSLGAVQFAAEEPDEDRPGGLWLSEAVTGTGLSWHLYVTLPKDRAELRFEARAFNRTFQGVPYSAGLLLPARSVNRCMDRAFFSADGGQGIAVIGDRGRWTGAIADGMLRVARFPETKTLAPRQLDTWGLSVVPFSGLDSISAVSQYAASHVDAEQISIQASRPLRQHKLVLLTQSGQSLEAPVEVDPPSISVIKLPEPLKAVALMDPSRDVVLKWEVDWDPVMPGESIIGGANESYRSFKSYMSSPDDELEAMTFEVGIRHLAQGLLGSRALAAGDFETADQRFEQALLYNAEDHLTWWMKALSKRRHESTGEEPAELMNAHYLAPLEPALRAESFLSQPRAFEKEPSALLKQMDEYPESFVEVAALLVEARLFEEAARWIGEALRHADLPMLRYLLAYSHLEASGLDLEAAQQVAAAASEPLGPPYPWRSIEIEVLRALAERFPDNRRLEDWIALSQATQRRSITLPSNS